MTTRRLIAALCVLCAAPTIASAQAADPASSKAVGFFSAAEMANQPARVLGTGSTYSYQTIIRDKQGEIEVHDTRNDIIVVQEGKAEAELGGTVTGGRVIAPGEHRGGTASGYRSQMLAPGDVIYIPAGLPHRISPAEGSSRFRYLVVKTEP